MGHDFGVVLKLIHPDILHLGAHRRDAPGGHKDEHIAVEEVFRGHHLYLGKNVVLPGQADLAHLKLPPGGDLVGQVADADGGDHISPQQLQPGEQGGAHVPDGQDVHPLLPRFGGPLQKLLPARAGGVDGGEAAVSDGPADVLVQLQGDGRSVTEHNTGGSVIEGGQAGGVQRFQTVTGLRQLAGVGDLEGGPAQHRVAGDGGIQPPALSGLHLGAEALQRGERDQGRAVDVVIIHDNITSYINCRDAS